MPEIDVIELERFSEPQRQAILNAQAWVNEDRWSGPDNDPWAVPSPCIRTDGQWKHMLDIRQLPEPMGWCWMSSVSRLRNSGRAIQVCRWKQKWVDAAKVKAGEQLSGVGERGLPFSTLIPVPEDQLHACYILRSLRQDEVALVEQVMRGRHA